MESFRCLTALGDAASPVDRSGRWGECLSGEEEGGGGRQADESGEWRRRGAGDWSGERRVWKRCREASPRGGM